ncbi:transcription-repair coupling factor [Candidatus Omnitrophota bacterium]
MFRSIKLYTSGSCSLEALLKQLIDFGYKKVVGVCEEGDFSVKGGIVDAYPAGFDCPLRIELEFEKIESIYSFNIITGKRLWEHQSVIILPIKRTKSSRYVKFSEEQPIDNFVELEEGDYAVHVEHGIGRYLGIEKLRTESSYSDHFVLQYDGGDKLYVPTQHMHLIQKYISFEGRHPKLCKLGSRQWQRIKNSAKKSIKRLALDLLQVQALRTNLPGFEYSKDSQWQEQFEETFPFQETPDQIEAMKAVRKDMESERPMDRLICGDVGYGKTEVALRAAFKAVMDNKQVAFLVPTTILAEQHYYNFTQRLKDFPIRVEKLSRFNTASQQKSIIEDLGKGSVDIVIGTHRLLSGDIKFKDLGLVIVDEEQRFGVKAKERFKHLRLLVDVITLTATPIPRTLYMSMMDAKDMSVINTPPQNRIPVKTFVSEFDDTLVKQAIARELSRRGQVYFVHNRVEGIEEIKKKIEHLSKSKRIGLAHGQMPSRLLEEVIMQFLKGRLDILVCTMIIEAGIDIPNANTLIVNHADNFGLSDLHQLRGRVGRFNRQAYAYLLVPKHGILSDDAQRRLKAIEEYSELGSGFRIAFEDLQIRGAGNLLGVEQHGYIHAIGFDLYCRMLREVVSHIKYGSEK